MGSKINARRCPRWSQDRGPRPLQVGAPHPRGPLVRRLMPFFGRKKSNFWKDIWAKVSIQSDLRISGYKRNGARAESKNEETERDREIDQISEGLSPLPRHGSQGPEGKPFSHLGRRSRKKKKKGALPPCFRWRRNAAGGHHHHRDLHQQLHHPHHQIFPPLCSGVTSLLPAVIST